MEQQFKHIAALIGDPTRATILWTLMDGKAFTATELAVAADTTPQNISMHLNKLLQADLLQVESQGRHRYYKFSRQDVAYAIEAMVNIVPPSSSTNRSVDMVPVKHCRTCYDHLAGKVAVDITDSMLKQQLIVYQNNFFEISAKGRKWFNAQGIDTDILRNQKRSFARPCLDWSERRHHLAGSLGAALLDHMLDGDWVRRTAHSRVIVITGKGKKKLQELFNMQ
ncbi:MAG TPA: winged helix-turn-helix domain-containing protein [Chitinophagaceae bacterium]|jgi:DNA-binding transcriptional ArsR family regulator|nr:winged helix-turn-helix domain-containing protein [Chitinophagaceae bacterium]